MWINPPLKIVPNRHTIYSSLSTVGPTAQFSILQTVFQEVGKPFIKNETLYLWPVQTALHLQQEHRGLCHRQGRGVGKYCEPGSHTEKYGIWPALSFKSLGSAVSHRCTLEPLCHVIGSSSG